MKRVYSLPGIALLALFATGCSDWGDAMSTQVDEYTVMLKTSPAPPEIGEPAATAVKIVDERHRTVRACHVSFRQFMPEHEMASDDVIIEMREQRSGVYSGLGPEYSMGGDWRIEVRFDCGDGVWQADFDVYLAWPEFE